VGSLKDCVRPKYPIAAIAELAIVRGGSSLVSVGGGTFRLFVACRGRKVN
jgi:hypothetical protein